MIFPVFYFGPISYFGELMRHKDFRLEACENFRKQTYRNRCCIQGANGKLRLTVPIEHDGSRAMKDIRVQQDYNWQREHFKSLMSAYKSSPYFEFYEDDLRPLYEGKIEFLLDFNLMSMDFIAKKLQWEFPKTLTESYEEIPGEKDFRNQFSAKKEPSGKFPEYTQVFSEKMDFIPDLSILDLLFNKGPASVEYLKDLS